MSNNNHDTQDLLKKGIVHNPPKDMPAPKTDTNKDKK